MQGHMRKHPTNVQTPFEDIEDKPIAAQDFIQAQFGDLPTWAIALRGFRNREGMSQSSLGNALGVAQTNISQMELGKRSIGKNLAKKFASFFKTDYRLFL